MDLEVNLPQPEGLSLGPQSTDGGPAIASAPLDLLLSVDRLTFFRSSSSLQDLSEPLADRARPRKGPPRQ